jgi:membrane-associated phospholipid phosphatase
MLWISFFLLLDQKIALYLHKHIHFTLIFKWMSAVTDPLYNLIFWGILSLLALRKRLKKYLIPFLHTFLAIFTLKFICGLLKIATGRIRPESFLKTGSYGFSFLGGTHDSFRSFPSSHAATTFALIYLWIFFKKPRHKIIIYLIGALFVSSRLFLKEHYLSDVIAGALVGIVSAKISLSLKKQIEQAVCLLDSYLK